MLNVQALINSRVAAAAQRAIEERVARNDHPTAHLVPVQAPAAPLAPSLTLPGTKVAPAPANASAGPRDMSRARQTWCDGFGCFDA